MLRERYLKLGGNVIAELEKNIVFLTESQQEKGKQADHYRKIIKTFQLSDELSEVSLKRNQILLAEKRAGIEKRRDLQQEKTLAALSELREHDSKLKDAETMLRKVRERPGSNIPPPFQDFRAELAAQLGLREGDVPFLAELVEVKPGDSAWRGAIERAMGAERLRILVPEESIDQVLNWVNHRDNRLHVRLLHAQRNPGPATFLADGYTNKLNFKPHALLPAARKLLAGCDLHCVDSTSALKTTERALTVQGMISRRLGKFEKQDRHRLDQNWMTGFDNKDQLDALTNQVSTIRQSLERWQAEVESQQRALSPLDERLTVIDSLAQLEFSTIDLPRVSAELVASQERLAALLDPRSDATEAKAAYDIEREQLQAIAGKMSDLDKDIAVLEAQASQARQNRDNCEESIGKGLSEAELTLAKTRLGQAQNIPAQRLNAEERRISAKVESETTERLARVAENQQNVVRRMEKAKSVDNGALADVGSSIEDVPHYLERLRILNEESLPEKRNRFLEYLNRSSDQGVTQLLARIKEEVDAIELRIEELNQTLLKVDFRDKRYLQLQPQRIADQRLRTVEAALRKVRSAALKDDGGESHYRALQELVRLLREAGENRRQQGSKALLDPRFRLQFFVVEVDRKTGDRSPPRTGSQSGSGGEKELMASHILTASLSYALCPANASRPLYATVILDEAFSKSSPSAASRIIEALRVFGLHPIFVTPNKEIGLLRQHTRKVICVQRPGKEASLASISWEKMEEFAVANNVRD
jgi:uncharacterized protein YPO0396